MAPNLKYEENKPAIHWLASIFGTGRSVPSLDGLRAISVMLVVISHLCGTRNYPLHDTGRFNLGLLGVRVFFVISGYLITSILLSELAKTGTINLKRFYVRRTLRLFPAAWIFIATAGVLGWTGWLALHRYDLLFAFTYTSNYYEGRSPAIGHLWSLAVEEQFYLLWPITLKVLGKTRSRRFLFGLIMAAPFCRLMSLMVAPAFNFLIWSDSLGTGCLLALLWKDLAKDQRYQRLISSHWIAVMPLAALAVNYIPSTKVSWLVGDTIQNFSIALCVHWSILNASTIVGRFLNLRFMASLGVLSYSLYLWQQLFSVFGVKSVLAVFPFNLVLMFAAALVSYLFIEKPFLRLRERLEPRWWPVS
jgi:peptidoglycan/LPS O-acetylase OafA/YrhL